MRTLILLWLTLLISAMALSAAECDSGAIRTAKVKDQLIIFNNSSKPIVAYVLATAESKSKDGSPIRTYSGVFTGPDSLAPGSSMEVGKADSRLASVDYIRFADGSTCGNAITVQAKTASARFAGQVSK